MPRRRSRGLKGCKSRDVECPRAPRSRSKDWRLLQYREPGGGVYALLWGLQMWKCPLGTKNYSLKEEKELQLIERNLHFNNLEHRWMTQYPWIRDPADLPDNRKAAFGMLLSTEKRLAKNTDHARVYQEQIQDMIDRGVARKLMESELETYDWPTYCFASWSCESGFKVYTSENSLRQ